MQSIWRALLRVEPALLGRALALLDARDATVVLVFALEFDDNAVAALVHEYSPFQLRDKSHLLYAAAAHGCFRTVLRLRMENLSPRTRRVLAAAPRLPALATVHDSTNSQRDLAMAWLSAYRPYVFPETVLYEAVRCGNLEVVEWLHTTTLYSPFIAVEYAARAGQLACAQWLADHVHDVRHRHWRCSYDEVAVEVTAAYDPAVGIFAWRVHTIQSIRSLLPFTRQGFAFQGECAAFDVGVASVRSGASGDPALYAMEHGNDELFEALQRSHATYKWPFTHQTLEHAVKRGRLDALQWMIEDGGAVEYDVSKLVTTAAMSNRVAVLEWLVTRLDSAFEFSFELLRDAICAGSLEVVQWAYERYSMLPVGDELTQRIGSSVSTPAIATWLHASKGLGLTPQLVHAFAQSSVADLMTFLSGFSYEQQREMLTPTIFQTACRAGRFDVARFLADERGVWNDVAARTVAAGAVALYKWVAGCGRPCHFAGFSWDNILRVGGWDLLADVAAQGRVTGVRGYTRESNSKFRNHTVAPETLFTTYFIWSDAHVKRRSTLRRLILLLLEHDPDPITCWSSAGPWAARHGFTDILRKLIAMGYRHSLSRANLERVMESTHDGPLVQLFLERRNEPPTFALFKWATEHRQVALLAYLFARVHEKQTQRDCEGRLELAACIRYVATVASKLGHLSVLKWLHHTISRERICPCTSAQHGHVHVLRWLYANSAMDERMLVPAVRASVKYGHVAVLQWYRDVGFEYAFQTSELESAVERGDVAVVRWIASSQPALVSANESLRLGAESLLATWQDLCV